MYFFGRLLITDTVFCRKQAQLSETAAHLISCLGFFIIGEEILRPLPVVTALRKIFEGKLIWAGISTLTRYIDGRISSEQWFQAHFASSDGGSRSCKSWNEASLLKYSCFSRLFGAEVLFIYPPLHHGINSRLQYESKGKLHVLSF